MRLRGRDLVARDGALDEQPLARTDAVVDHVAPGERVRLARAEALVSEDADERGVGRAELGTDDLDRLRAARIDRLGVCV